MSSWTVFNDTGTATNTVLYTGNVTWSPDLTINSYPSLPVQALPEDPLRWLHERVKGVCDLGRLD